MNFTDELRLELEALLNRLADESLTETERERLGAIFLQCPAARRHYVRFANLGVSLQDYSGEAQLEASPMPGAWNWKQSAWWVAAGVGVAAALALAFFSPGSKPAGPGGDVAADDGDDVIGESVAILHSAENCLWDSGAWRVGDSFSPGQVLNLRSGVAEIAFDSGVRMVVQGPSELKLSSAWDASLIRGLVRASVPPEAIGFRVNSPEVEVVDLGTEFSVAADASGASDVLVHEGKVHVKPKNAPAGTRKALLREKEAKRFAKSGVTEVPNGDQKWTALAGKLSPAKIFKKGDVRSWDFESKAPHAPNMLSFIAQGRPDFLVAEGKYGAGWEFDGTWSAHTILPTYGNAETRSLALWVKIPQETMLSDAAPVLAWNPALSIPGILELGWNGDPSAGVATALTLRCASRSLVGTTPLLDGKWHHLTIVLNVRPKFQATGAAGHELQMKVYVDGKLEPRSGKMQMKKAREQRLAEQLALAPGTLVLGRDWQGNDPFRGSVDELVVADRPLGQGEIRQLMGGLAAH